MMENTSNFGMHKHSTINNKYPHKKLSTFLLCTEFLRNIFMCPYSDIDPYMY